ncbi:MAG: glycoside hydrolase [Acidithiobacillus sp.]|uniref:glycoside hydrolase n=1 Tax=Acidithiobacillus sp. TaxID=1872118 RepID=UPI003D049463
MQPARALHVIFCWHMHQPDYRGADGHYILPWTYLHACKDYADMVAHLEENPLARAVFNFVPTLIEQLEDYGEQFRSGQFRDGLLAALAADDLKTLTPAARHSLLHQCFRLDQEHMLNPFPDYRRLYDLYQHIQIDVQEMADYLSVQYLADLVMWYHLAWTGETVRRGSPFIQAMLAKGRGFTREDRQQLLRLLGDLIHNLIPRYRRLAEAGRIELSTTPYDHPIGPLLMDFGAARESLPDCPLPQSKGYPGGAVRARWHVDRALAAHQQRFGLAAGGQWPAEGGVSEAFVQVLGEAGIGWTATGEGVLAHSLRTAADDEPARERWQYLYRAYRLPSGGPALFFRDDALSDAIGFDYQKWFGHDAVGDFVHRLEEIWRRTEGQGTPVVSIILDGENAWEYYPYNGYYFLSELYKVLSNHPHIQLCTFSDYLAHHDAQPETLPHLVAGSWVYGNFSTWIGDSAKNRAWDLLCAAKQAVDQRLTRFDPAQQELILRQLGVCEGSDWFWWFGDYNPAAAVRDFDELYRANLRKLYGLIGMPAPRTLDTPISQGGAPAAAAGTMRRTTP